MLVGVLLIVSLCGTMLAARAAFNAIHGLQVQQKMTQVSDVRSISPWMTLPLIARIYHVPPAYLYTSLNIRPKDRHLTHATLNRIASATKQPVSTVVSNVQKAVLRYHQEHHQPTTPTTIARSGYVLERFVA